ncbi:MAG: mandelate racemase/muconate lactonizing enzyme family protein [Armatimonadetes bacterium]|nr:mandelate racemase/muconate lactonizing enzyme family protein [Armatimonadota bacterium]
MIITAVDPFYLKLPVVTDAADGTQDTVLIRIRADNGMEGWGECDASPLVTIATYCCPMSHGNIINLRESLVGETLETVEDIERLHKKALRNGLDIQQIHHAYSGADIALWDLLGKHLGQPVCRLLGEGEAHPKIPYASVLFEETPEATRERAEFLKSQGYRAAKFGWGPMGRYDEACDVALVREVRRGLGEDAHLMVDAGVAWGHDAETAYARAVAFAPYHPTWLEEPLLPDAVEAYAALQRMKPPVPIAGGEGSGRLRDAADVIQNGGLDFVQIDVGRIGGITTAYAVRQMAERQGIQYVNHTFKSHLSVAASLHVFATAEAFRFLEYPAEDSPLAHDLATRLERDADGLVRLNEAPGLGVDVNLDCAREYLQPLHIEMAGETLYETPEL